MFDIHSSRYLWYRLWLSRIKRNFNHSSNSLSIINKFLWAWRDLNPHGIATTGFWIRRAYQFRHKPKLDISRLKFVGLEGLEPSRIAAPDPKSGVIYQFHHKPLKLKIYSVLALHHYRVYCPESGPTGGFQPPNSGPNYALLPIQRTRGWTAPLYWTYNRIRTSISGELSPAAYPFAHISHFVHLTALLWNYPMVCRLHRLKGPGLCTLL